MQKITELLQYFLKDTGKVFEVKNSEHFRIICFIVSSSYICPQLSKAEKPFYYQQVAPLNSINEGNLTLALLDIFCNCWLSKLLLMILLILNDFKNTLIVLIFWFKFLLICHHFFPFKILLGSSIQYLAFEALVYLCSFYLCTLQMSLLTPWQIWHSTQIQNKSIFKNFSQELQELPLQPFLIFENGVMNAIFIYSVFPHDTFGLWPVVEAQRNVKQILLKLYLLYHRHCCPS